MQVLISVITASLNRHRMSATGVLIFLFPSKRQRGNKMIKPNSLRWLPVMLLVLILYPAFARQAKAQGLAGDIVEIQWGGQPTKAKIEHCTSDACDLYLWDAGSAKWSNGTLWKSKSEIRGLKDQVNERAVAPPVGRAPPPQQAAGAQVATTYKVGDKIECNVTGKWQPGTIVKVTQGAYELAYLVNTDGEASTWDRFASASQIRERTGLISETAKAHNQLTALGALKAPKTGSNDETFQNLIRERYELQGSKEFPVTVTFQGFVIGQTHPYSRADVYGESADGPGGSTSTTVYPVKAQYFHRHAYRDAFLTYQQDEVYQCFKNSFGKWQCNPASGGKGMIKQFREEKAG
jgi:hypothetical protein